MGVAKRFNKHLLRQISVQRIPSKVLWNKLIPSKVAAFGWRAVLGWVPMRVNLIRRGVVREDQIGCVGCQDGLETVPHLLFGCNFASKVWGQVLHWLGFTTVMHSDCKQHFLQF